MKRIIVAVIALLIAALLFWAGGRYGKGPSAVTGVEPVYAKFTDEKEKPEVPLSPGAVKINQARQQLIGVKVAAVEKTPMTYTLRLYGRVVPDETKTYRVNASTDCWIRKISDVTTGSIVRKDQILAEALAPSYYNSQFTYLIALDNLDRIKRQLGGQLRHQQSDLANNQIRVAVQALQNLGITDAQTEELANTRQARPYLQVRAPNQGVVLNRNITLNQWFKAAEEFYTIADLGKIWVYADVYENEAMHLWPGTTVKIRHAQMGKTFSASVGQVLPLFNAGARTLKVRIDVDNPRYDLRPDMFVDVEIPITMPPSVNVPDEAVLDLGTKATVYVDIGNGIFEPRRVKTGWRLGRRIEITAGLIPGERIAVSGNFLIDSESRMEISALGVKVSEDPVCGRRVDAEEAKMSERIATYAHETYYFCSEECKKEFEKEPEKYFPKERTDRSIGNHAAPTGEKRSWADLLTPVKGGQSIKEDGAESMKETKHILDRYPTTPEVVDWDGPDKEGGAAQEWSKGWGGFPGARYLGIKQEDKEVYLQRSNPSEAGDKKTVDEVSAPEAEADPDPGDHELNPRMREPQASGPPQRSAEQ